MDQTPAAGTAFDETAVRRDHDELTLFVDFAARRSLYATSRKNSDTNSISILIFELPRVFLLKSNKFAVIYHRPL
jgi:hypothetical protein